MDVAGMLAGQKSSKAKLCDMLLRTVCAHIVTCYAN